LWLTAGIDNPVGGAGNDTFNATGTTLTSLDVINGGAGTDTLSIVDTAGVLTAAPSNVTLTSIEAVSISTTGDLGVVAGGVTAVPQVNKVTFAPVTADVTGSKQIVFSAVSGGTDGTQQMTYNGLAASFDHDVSDAAITAANFISSTNSTAGKTVAYIGGTDAINAAVTATTATTVSVATSGLPASLQVGMSLSYSGSASGLYITKIEQGETNTIITLNKAVGATASNAATITFGGGAAGVTVFGETRGEAAKAISFGTNAGSVVSTAQSLIVTNVDGNQGDVVTFSYAGQSGQFTVGATNDETATAFALALNNVTSDATAAVVAGSGDTDHVTLTADTAGTALGALVFSGAGSNTPTVTTATANRVATAVTAAAYDVSGMTTDAVNVVMADSANLKAAATSDVNVSGVTGAITVAGGKNVTITDSTADKAIDLDDAKGTVTVTDTKQGTAAISVGEGTDVTITAGAQDDNTSTITVGDTATAVTGAVVVNATGKAYAAGASETFGTVTVRGGTTVNVNLAATSDSSKIATDTSAGTHTFGVVRVDAEDGTTAITIVQDAAVAAVNYEAAVAAKAATQTLTVGAMAAGDVFRLTFDTNDLVTFTAARALTATEAANAFANWVALSTSGSAPASDGTYGNGSGTIDKSWTSGAVTTNAAGTSATVTFTTATASPTDLVAAVVTGTSGAFADGAVTAGVTANQAVTGRVGVTNSAIDINGATTAANDAVKVVTLTNFASAAIESDVIETLNLTGSAGAAILTTASTGSITVNAGALKTGSQISVDGGSATVTGMTLNVLSAFTGDLVASAVTDLTINATGKFTSENATDIDAVKTLTVTGAGAVDLGTVGTGLAGSATAINASANTGGLTITYGSDTGTFTGGAGADVVTTDSETISKAVDLGAGNDTYVLAADSSGTTVTATLNGGDGEDTLRMSSAAAERLDANTVFASAISGFEVLSLGALANSADIVAKNLGLNSKVIVAGTASSSASTISTLAANASVQITGAVTTSLTLALETATGTADAINIKTDIDGNLTVGTVIVANVETVNLSAVDKFVDVSGAKDEFDANIADGKDDTNSVQSIDLDIDEATTLNITGSADLTVDILDNTGSGGANANLTTLVDASTFTGKLTLIADGKPSGMTVKGGSGDDTLTADGSNDVLIGGAGNDTIILTTLTTATGGEGKDTFVFATAADANTYSRITDLSAGDVIDTSGVADTFVSAKVVGTAQSTFADYLLLATLAMEGLGDATLDDSLSWFQFGGNTYLVSDADTDANDTFVSTSSVLEIVGLVDLSTAVFNATTGTLTIA
jgi:S-layer protein